MIAKRKKQIEKVEVTKFVASLPGYEDFDYKPLIKINSWFWKRSANDYETERTWKKKRLTAGLNH
jgi:hypothetical protein